LDHEIQLTEQGDRAALGRFCIMARFQAFERSSSAR